MSAYLYERSMMQLRIPYTSPLPIFPPIPTTTTTLSLAITAVSNFLRSTPPHKTVTILSGAGISVDSGLKDYRGPNGTYTANKNYRPTFYGEFISQDKSRRRYWARSFVGWKGVDAVRPNKGHHAVGELWRMGYVGGVVTQNVDSLHQLSSPSTPTVNLHGSLHHVTCLHCHTITPRESFQASLSSLNPIWRDLLRANTDPEYEFQLRPNPDGDIDVPGAPYSTFRYPACSTCLSSKDGDGVKVDGDGAYLYGEGVKGVLKPTLVFFGESLQHDTRIAAERMVESNSSDALLVLGSSLATFSAWRLVKKAKDLGKRIGMVNLGGVRGEEVAFWGEVGGEERSKVELGDGSKGVRVHFGISEVMKEVVDVLRNEKSNVRRVIPENTKEEVEAGRQEGGSFDSAESNSQSESRVEHHNVAY